MDLATTYLGLELRTPVIASAGPPTATADGVRALAAAGAGAVVLPSVFEEQLRFQADPGARMAAAGTGSFAEALGRLPLPRDSFESWPGKYLRLIGEAARTSGIPVIASLNGATPGGWSDYAAAMEDAGAAAIELNVYDLPGDPMRSARASEAGYAEMLPHVRAAVNIPVAVKLAPFSGSPGEAAFVLDQAGADGLVLFNRFLQTDIDAEALTVSAGFGLISAGGSGAAPGLDQPAARTGALFPGRLDRRRDRGRRRRVPAGGRGRGDDDVRAAAAWPRLPQ